jgi:hypothetical protein
MKPCALAALQDLLADRAVQYRAHDGRLGAEQEGHGRHHAWSAQMLFIGAMFTRDHRHGADLGLLDGVLLGAQRAVVEHLDAVLAVGQLPSGTSPMCLTAVHRRVAVGVDVGRAELGRVRGRGSPVRRCQQAGQGDQCRDAIFIGLPLRWFLVDRNEAWEIRAGRPARPAPARRARSANTPPASAASKSLRPACPAVIEVT